MKKRGILIRHFTGERLEKYNRITIGTRAEMEAFLFAAKKIIEDAEVAEDELPDWITAVGYIDEDGVLILPESERDLFDDDYDGESDEETE